MSRLSATARLCGIAVLAGAAAGNALAHGFAGKRFFPATLATDDPFVADELSLPAVSRRKTGASPGEPATLETDATIDFSKRVTPNLGVGLEVAYLSLKPEGGEAQKGFDNLAASVKYQFFKSDGHESILSAGIDWDIGNTGAKRTGAESFGTLTPTLFAGKGLGELPDGLDYLKPFAITGSVGVALPTRSSTTTVADDGSVATTQNPDALRLGFALEYSLPYLQSFVKDVGLGEPFSRLIPIVELSLRKPLDRGGGPWTGTVNPGVLWTGRQIQLGLEAIIPATRSTGGKTGVLFQLHFYLDDLFPRSLGRPPMGD